MHCVLIFQGGHFTRANSGGSELLVVVSSWWFVVVGEVRVRVVKLGGG